MASLDGYLEAGTVLAGKLRIIRLIGEGGMGAVYEVEHEFTKHRRALKLLRPEHSLSPGVVGRFLREASAAGRIGNPHIVETFDAGTLDGGAPYIVMELLEGRALADVLVQRERLDLRAALEILEQACAAIQAAHDAGIVHRDLKPDNLFLVASDQTFVKVLDFGISKFDPARAPENQITHDSATLGTPYYMSPEQIRGAAHVDGRTDVYALAVVLYECLTGNKPFMADTVPALAVLIHEGKYQPLSSARPEAPPALEQVLARALHVDRDQRYPTPAAFARALRAVDDGKSSGRGHTLVSELPAPALSSPPRTLAIPAETHAGVASDTPRERRRLSKLVFAAPVVLLAVFAALALGNRVGPGHAASPSARPSSPLLTRSEDVVPVPVPAPAPQVSPELRAPEPAPSRSPPPVAGVKNHPRSSPSAATSRARQHGLAEDNPFR